MGFFQFGFTIDTEGIKRLVNKFRQHVSSVQHDWAGMWQNVAHARRCSRVACLLPSNHFLNLPYDCVHEGRKEGKFTTPLAAN